MKKHAFTPILLFILCFALISVLKITPVYGSGTIYIRADGSIYPPDAPISTVDNVTYTLTGNITSDAHGIVVQRNNTTIDGSEYLVQGSGSGGGFNLTGVDNVTIKNTNIKNFYTGIIIFASSNCSIIENNLAANIGFGISLDSHSTNNEVYGNNITDNLSGGIWLYSSSNNVISKNNIINSGGHGILNSVCGNTTISENNITNNNETGVVLGPSPYPNYNIVSGNSITNNGKDGIWLVVLDNCNNRISGNDITNNNEAGILVTAMHGRPNNTIYHNNFINNKIQVNLTSAISSIKWDDGYPSGGNYWSDYDGTDSDYDGIGDTPYFIDANNQDNYPLMGMFSSFNTSYGYAVDFVSNSSISDVSFNLTPVQAYSPINLAVLAFNVSGETGTDGFLRVCIPKILISGLYLIMFDDLIITKTTYPQVRELPCSNETYEYLYINYTHSKHNIIIQGLTLVSEFPSFLMLPLCMIATLLAVIVYKRKKEKLKSTFAF